MMIRLAITAVSLFGVSFSVRAEDSGVTTAASSAKIGGEFKAEMVRADNGFQKYEGHTPDSATTIDVSKTRIVLSGKINPDTDYKFKFNLFNPTTTPLYYGYGTYNFSLANTGMGLSIGKMKVQQGGWDNKLNEFSDHVQGYYNKNFAFKSYEPMIALSVKAAGKATLQLVNDITTDNTGQWNDNEHPTVILGWFGELGSFSPAVAYGSYDNNKSNWIDLGGKLETGDLKSSLDLKLDTISNKVADGSKAKSKEDKSTSVTIKVAYTLKSLMTPWVYYSSYDKKQYTDSATAKKDIKVNDSQLGTDGKFVYALNDNAVIIGAGADLLMLGANWIPYLAVTSTTAKFASLKDPDKVETKSSGTIHLGCYGTI